MSDLAPAELLALYDHDERFAATFPDTRREELPNLVRHVDLVGNSGAVIYSRLHPTTLDAAIEQQVTYFETLGREFEWKAYAHDEPSNLVERLADHGFELDEPEAILVLDLRVASEPLAATSAVRVKRVEHPDELEAIGAIRLQVYGDNPADQLARLRLELTHDSHYLAAYLAYMHDAPVACGWIRFPRGSAFASLWGGATIPQQRGQGAYTALVAARVSEARQRGVRYLTVDARSMSRPILERRGFTHLATATACTWSPSSVGRKR
jgi:GNAT superfamily N-acetyltransferase